MKNTLILFILIFVCNLSAQTDYSFEIENNIDSTFNLLVIEQLSNDRARIEKYSNLDTVVLQARIYSDINAAYERVARLQREIDEQIILRNQLLSALNSKSLNNYALDTRTRLDSFYIAPSWLYRSSADDNEILTPIYREGNTTLMRDTANANFAIIVPKSPNNITIRFLPAGTNDVELFSSDSRVYVGRDSEGVRHVLIKRRR